jgi:hypothetical protein
MGNITTKKSFHHLKRLLRLLGCCLTPRMRSDFRIGALRVYGKALRLLPIKWRICIDHFRCVGKWPNLKNPRGINEKIEWRKLYQRDPRFSEWSDKIAVKKLVADIIGEQHVIPTLWHGKRIEDAPLHSLPLPYIIKSNTGSSNNVFIYDYADINLEMLRRRFNSIDPNALSNITDEWHYQFIEPQILIEPLLQTVEGKVPEDYKMHIFHGKTRFIQYDVDRFTGHKRAFLTPDWTLIPVKHAYDIPNPLPPKPTHLEDTVTLAERLLPDIDYVRIDMYHHANHIYFGEATFTPGGGREPYHPNSYEQILGAYWTLEPYKRLSNEQQNS